MRIFQTCESAIRSAVKLLQSGKTLEPRLWLATDHRWLPTRHLPTMDSRVPQSNSLPLSTGSVGGALAPRKLIEHCKHTGLTQKPKL